MPDLQHEYELGYPLRIVVGVDEVGRGCIAGPVVAGAVALPPEIDFERDPWLREIDDSKSLSAAQREKLAPLIERWALSSAIGISSVEEIDQVNIFQASHLALIRAVENLRLNSMPLIADQILVDGKFLPKQGFSAPATAIIKGDLKCLSIAAASILAKVWRDRHMDELDQRFPMYGFAKHKGYPTPAHAQTLRKVGISSVHRRSFKTVSALL